MKVGDLARVKDIIVNHKKDVGKIGIIIHIFERVGRYEQLGYVCRLYTGTEKLNYLEGRLEAINERR